MTNWMYRIPALLVLSGGALFAQDLTGTWQGTLHAGKDLRVVYKISKADGGSLKAVMYSIDQGGQPINASAATLQGSTVKIAVSMIGGTFEGKLGADGNTITGTWTQGTPMPLNLTRATAGTEWAIPEPPPRPVRMAAGAKPAFEVATIKPSQPGRPGKLFTLRGQEVVTMNTSLSDLVTMAYDLHPRQIVGAPGWFESDRYDVTGKPDTPGQPNVNQMKMMLQKLVVDRFQLKFHKDKKELSAYALTVAKGGPKISKSEADPNGLPGLFFGGPGTNLHVMNATMDQVAQVLQGSVLDRPVVNQTGLNEKYDFTLKWTPDRSQFLPMGGPPPPPPDLADAPPDLFSAVQQQLGLKLEATKASVDVLVIDHVEKPSAN